MPPPEVTTDTMHHETTTAVATKTVVVEMRVTEGITWTDEYREETSPAYKALERRVVDWVRKSWNHNDHHLSTHDLPL